jgi:AbrB family looped-hinge helix DNA binding protein
MATATITPEGYIEVPKDILELLHLAPGDTLEIETENDRGMRMRPKTRPLSEIAGMLRPYIHTALTLEEMDEKVAEAFRKGNYEGD